MFICCIFAALPQFVLSGRLISDDMMKIWLSVLCCICCIVLNAQGYKNINCENAAANLNPYPVVELDKMPAPEGYQPFYISHYGRHGSRYLTHDVKFDMVMKYLEDASKSGLLTEVGKQFYSELQQIYVEQSELEGILTARGAEEHQGIAERMVRNYPSVFSADGEAKRVRCVSSVVHRCLLSMSNFVLSMGRIAPDVKIEMTTGERYMSHICLQSSEKFKRQNPVKVNRVRADEKEDSLRRVMMDPSVMFDVLFTKPSKMRKSVDDAHDFCRHLYLASCNGLLTDVNVNILRHYPVEELQKEWFLRNERFYMAYAFSKENDEVLEEVARPILSDFIEKADVALGDDVTAADLRFGHDTGLLPLVTFIGLEGQPGRLAFGSVSESWNSSEKICMGSNLQMIFYKNADAQILVKFRYNEADTCLSGLAPDSDVFYEWTRLRAYLLSL